MPDRGVLQVQSPLDAWRQCLRVVDSRDWHSGGQVESCPASFVHVNAEADREIGIDQSDIGLTRADDGVGSRTGFQACAPEYAMAFFPVKADSIGILHGRVQGLPLAVIQMKHGVHGRAVLLHETAKR